MVRRLTLIALQAALCVVAMGCSYDDRAWPTCPAPVFQDITEPGERVYSALWPVWRGEEPGIVRYVDARDPVSGLPPYDLVLHELEPSARPVGAPLLLQSTASAPEAGAAEATSSVLLVARSYFFWPDFWSFDVRGFGPEGESIPTGFFLSWPESLWAAAPYLSGYRAGFLLAATVAGNEQQQLRTWVWTITGEGEVTGEVLEPFAPLDVPPDATTFPWCLGQSALGARVDGSAALVARSRAFSSGGTPGLVEVAWIDATGTVVGDLDLGVPWGPLAVVPAGADFLVFGVRPADTGTTSDASLEVLRVRPGAFVENPVTVVDAFPLDCAPSGDVFIGDQFVASTGSIVLVTWPSAKGMTALQALDGDTLEERCRWDIPDAYSPRVAGTAEGILVTTLRTMDPEGRLQAAVLRWRP